MRVNIFLNFLLIKIYVHIKIMKRLLTIALSMLQKKVAILSNPINIKFNCLKLFKYLINNIKQNITGKSLYEYGLLNLNYNQLIVLK